jgi:ubiquitin C-terminal hydrolase
VSNAKAKDAITVVLQMMLSHMKKPTPDADTIAKLGPISWKTFAKALYTKSPSNLQFLQGQQCSSESISLMLDLLEGYSDVQRLFEYRKKVTLRCPECNQEFSSITEKGNLMELDIAEMNAINSGRPTESILANTVSFTDDHCLCPHCNMRSPKRRTCKLTMVPEIIIIVSKKYTFNQRTNVSTKVPLHVQYPETLSFAAPGTSIHYRAVAYIDHAGGMNGGHYWAVCRRAGQWYQINDRQVSKGSFSPNANTYIIMYHVFNVAA